MSGGRDEMMRDDRRDDPALRALEERLDAQGGAWAASASVEGRREAVERSLAALRASGGARGEPDDARLSVRSRAWWARPSTLALAAAVALAVSLGVLLWPAGGPGASAASEATLAGEVEQEVDLWLAISEPPPSWESLGRVTAGLESRDLDVSLGAPMDDAFWDALGEAARQEEVSS
jgi:hypothetical protein